jgi:hypothetical protein
VIGTGYNSTGVVINSWGMRGTLTWEAIAALCTQQAGGAVYVLCTPDQLAKGATKAPNGVSWADLIADFDAMGGHIPLPPPPPPVIVPGSIGLVQVEQIVAYALNHSPPMMTRAMAIRAVNAALAAYWPKTP